VYDTQIALDREFMRRMIRAYEQDLLTVADEAHPDYARTMDHLNILELLRQQTFSSFQQSITF
jgi:hypothetical protein